MPKQSPIPRPEQVLLTVEQTATLLGLARSSAYALVKANVIPSVLVGSRLRVSRAALDAYVRRLQAESEQQDRRFRAVARRSA